MNNIRILMIETGRKSLPHEPSQRSTTTKHASANSRRNGQNKNKPHIILIRLKEGKDGKIEGKKKETSLRDDNKTHVL